KYSYDFLTNVDGTMPAGSLGLNECSNLPPFVTSANCTSLFSGPDANTALPTIPTDPFDAVGARENPASRSFRVGCIPACFGSAMVTFPNLDGPGEPNDAPGLGTEDGSPSG